MITKDNFKMYQSLYEKINQALGFDGSSDDKQKITDINDYFMELDKIRDYVVGSNGDPSNPENDPIFLIMPGDGESEQLFEIDANSRKIAIPSDFARNGVGVQGDELAEIIYFSIDRYFDIIDLYDKDIFIQWEGPDGDHGLSAVINKTLSYEAGKVVFGWPITSEITKKAGNVKFAVRFYERQTINNKPTLVYSFSTLTANIKINPALDFIIDDENSISAVIIDKNRLIYNNLRKSNDVGVDVPAVIPTFDLNNFIPQLGEYDLGAVFQGRAFFTNNDNENGMGTISYAWQRRNRTNDVVEIINDTPKYVAVEEDEVKNDNDTYFIKNSLTDTWEPYKGNLPAEDGIIVYKLFASITPEEAGKYHLIARNYAGRGNESEAVSETPWIISFAKEPVLNYEAHIKLDENFEGITIEVTAPDNGELSYQWQKYSNEVEKFEDINNEVNNVLPKNAIVEGLYRIQVKNTKNNDSITINSESIRVTNPPNKVPIVSYLVDGKAIQMESTGYNLSMGASSHIISVIVDDSIPHDSISYQWYDGDIAIEGATESSYTVRDVGTVVYLVITNNYNTFTEETVSYKFTTLK